MINRFFLVTFLMLESGRIIDGSSIESRFLEAPRRDAAWRRTEMSTDRTLQGIDYGLDVPSVTTERDHHPNNVPVIRYSAGSQEDDASNDADSAMTMDVDSGEFRNYNPDFAAESDQQSIDSEEQQQYDSSDSAQTARFVDAEDEVFETMDEGYSKQQLDPFERSRRYGYVDTTIQGTRTIPNEYAIQIFYPYESGYDDRSLLTEDIRSPYMPGGENSAQRLPTFYRTNYPVDDSQSGTIDDDESHVNLGQSTVFSKSRQQQEEDSRPRVSRKRRVTGRRYFLEPLIDGAILGTLGALFSDEIKREANKDRIEREKAQEQELLEKYTKIFNDPVEFAKLAREAANSPTYINQYIRRSFPLLTTRLYEEYRASLPNHVAARLTGPNDRSPTRHREYSPRTFYKNHIHPHQRRLVVDSNRLRYPNKSRGAHNFPVRRT